MTKSRTNKVIRKIEFVGPPRRLEAVGDLPNIVPDAKVTGPVSKMLEDGRQALRLRSGGRRTAGLRLRLGRQTPPGVYTGEIDAQKEKIPFIARVLPDTRVSVMAGELNFQGAPGDVAMTTLAIANTGNTDISLPRAIPVALFDDDGIEAAFAASYAKPRATLDEFFSAFHERLRNSHTGLMKLAVARGYGTRAAGSSFSADFKLSIPEEIKAGRRFHGVATTDFFELSVTLSVTKRS